MPLRLRGGNVGIIYSYALIREPQKLLKMNIKIQHLGGFYSPKLPDNITQDTEIVIMDLTFGRPLVCAAVWKLSNSVEIHLMSYSINPDSVKYGTVTYFLTETQEA